MDDQLDNDLKNRIREVFDNYEDTTADEGWLLLREKFPAQRKRRGIIWLWWSAAAILLAFLGIGLWMNRKHIQPKDEIVKKVTQQPKHENLAIRKVAKDTADNAAPAVHNKAAGKFNNMAVNRRNHTKPDSNNQAALVKPAVSPNNATNQNIVNQLAKKPANLQQIPGNVAVPSNTPAVAALPKNPAANTLATPDVPVNSPNAAKTPATVTAQQKQPGKTIMDMFANDKGKQPDKKDADVPDKKVKFGVYAGTYFNYSKGSDNQVNLGAGVTSDIKISKNLKVVTGISIAQNSMSYGGFPTALASAKSNLTTPSSYGVQAANITAASTPTVKNYNASLVGLDVPVNLKYEISPDKSDAYISLGLSSGTFINESYSYKYNYPSFLSSSLQATRDQTTGNSFNSFYFAKTLNVAFGVGYPFGKNRLIIEPFLKYPLAGMGSQDLRFGAGGVNLKFNFLSSHK
ncbi:hypothetical protein [Mucilaginibacter sp.]|uniref:hypothetical protein n=1 Tax=Mucilaginibacter sp. TaxID=1882438 RepID=UPI0025EA0CD3|nr:hypothetical protein [Mucilaginibacter sp.]